jgi:hypothetical protein
MSERAPVVAVTSPAGLADALAGDADWLWCLDPGARAGDGAQAALLAAAQDGGGRVALVAGMVLDAGGRPAEWALPGAAYDDVSGVITLVERHLCPIRHAPLHNCLLDRAVLAGYGLPDVRTFGPYAGAHWTARALRDHRGLFCADAVATLGPRDGPPGGPPLLGPTLRMARSGAWTRGESLHALAAVRRRVPRRAGARAARPRGQRSAG